MGEQANRSEGGDTAVLPPSKWQWAFAAVGLALVVGVIGYMARYALTAGSVVPDVTVERVSTHATRGGHIVRFRARNHASAVAASLRIEGELRQGSSVVETSDATLDYLPSFSERRGGLFFQRDPEGYELRLVSKGYTEP